MPEEITTPESTFPAESSADTKEMAFKLEKIDAKTARKTDQTESVTILNMDFLRQQKIELEAEMEVKQKALSEISEIVSEFDKL